MDDFRLAEARFRDSISQLQRVPYGHRRPDDLRDTIIMLAKEATTLLERGVDTPSLRVLAGEDDADEEEVERYLDRAVLELGHDPLTWTESILLVATVRARDLIAGRLSAREFADDIEYLYLEDSFPMAFQQLVGVAYALEDTPWGASEMDLMNAAAAFLRSVEVVPRKV